MIENDILANNPLYVVDVGARDGMHPRWAKFTSSYRGILFEPEQKEYDLLKSMTRPPKSSPNVKLIKTIW